MKIKMLKTIMVDGHVQITGAIVNASTRDAIALIRRGAAIAVDAETEQETELSNEELDENDPSFQEAAEAGLNEKPAKPAKPNKPAK